ncbi:hypothetical protein E2C01_017176 [Portunus trituberculatus]|uniref:Uncharacterized protein n=1 Tax=Portunus trituberculatus TaxID=210409 RepID=A0A5B7DS75_PORTR|nr:hypothetical protein [Portunus trituberculatus]
MQIAGRASSSATVVKGLTIMSSWRPLEDLLPRWSILASWSADPTLEGRGAVELRRRGYVVDRKARHDTIKESFQRSRLEKWRCG